MGKRLDVSAKVMQHRYRVMLLLGAGLLLGAIAGYGWVSIRSERVSLQAALRGQAGQLQLSIDDTLDIAQSHVAGMRQSVERGLAFPELVDQALVPRMRGRSKGAPPAAPLDLLPKSLQTEVGSLYLDPTVQFEKGLLERDLAAASSMLNIAAADHVWHKVFAWSYYYDAQERWLLLYPAQSQDELFAATNTKDMPSAFKEIFKADGTYPVLNAGPQRNPMRKMVWTPPYLDASGKGMMVSLLAPIYLGTQYIGALGADVTLQMLDSVLLQHPVQMGRAFVVDGTGLVIADSGGGLLGAKTKLAIGDLMPGIVFPFDSLDNPEWTRLPLRGTDWSLLVHVPDAAIRDHLILVLRPYFAMAFALMLSVMVLAWIQNRRYARPALQLAEYMDLLQSQPEALAPSVPKHWVHWFDAVAHAARERRRLWAQAQAQAVQLEETVEERTHELSAANEELVTTVAELTRVQESMEQSQVALQQSNAILERLGEIGKELTSQLDTNHVFDTIHKRLDGLLDATSFRIQLLEPDGKGLSSAYGMENGKRMGPLYIALAGPKYPLAARCFIEKQELHFQSISEDEQRKFHVPGTLITRSALFFPLLVGQRAIGVMTVQSARDNAYSDNDKRVFRTLCSYAAIALENAVNYAKLRETQQQLVVGEKFVALGSMVVGVAHELNTPIGNGLLVASTMESQVRSFRASVAKGDLRRAALDHFLDDTERATEFLQASLNKAGDLVQTFKRVAEDRTSEQQRVFDLAETTQEVLATVRHRIEGAGHQVVVEIPVGIAVDSYPGPYGELLTQMVDNALAHAFHAGFAGTIHIHVRTLPGNQVEWNFADNGQGISEEDQKKIFDPFFTTRLGQGSNGLGLSISYNIATALFGGQLFVQSTRGAGTQFLWTFPMQASHK